MNDWRLAFPAFDPGLSQVISGGRRSDQTQGGKGCIVRGAVESATIGLRSPKEKTRV